MNQKTFGAIALLAALAVPAAASAATAVATTAVNLRAGPSTAYPAVNVVASGAAVNVYGCLSDRSWCDVSYGAQRGWMASNYLAYVQGGQRYAGARVVSGAPVIAFSFGNYWDDHYRGRAFYRDRARWERQDRRRDIRDARGDVREERREVRDARADLRQERRAGGNTRAERAELREERQDLQGARWWLRRQQAN